MKLARCPNCLQRIQYEKMLDDKLKLVDHLDKNGNWCPGSRSEVNE